MLLHDLLLSGKARAGSVTALVRAEQSLSYDETVAQAQKFAAGLLALGLSEGDRVGIYLNKRAEAVIGYFGSSIAGLVFVPINTSLKASQVAHILDDCQVSALLTTGPQLDGLDPVLQERPNLRALVLVDPGDRLEPGTGTQRIDWDQLLAHTLGDHQSNRLETDVAGIFYTSGSTGRPKGVVVSHRNLVAGAQSVSTYLSNSPRDVILAALPFSFDAGFSQLTTAFAVGASVVLIDYLLPRDVIRAIERYGVTGLAGVPPLWTQLASLDWPDKAVQSLAYITNTGGAMPTAILHKLQKKLPNTRIFLMYGLTEAFRSTYLPPEELHRRPTSMGKAIPNAEIMVVRDDGTPCSPGEHGELVHRGPLVSLGYWNDPERTARRFRPVPNQPSELPLTEIAVWSGDTVMADEEGFLYFVGRKDDMIKSSGYRISPTEIEELIHSTGQVVECAAIGVPHLELGQAVVVVFRAISEAASVEQKLLKACRAELPNYMVPSQFVPRDSLPKNANGKIDRQQLKEELKGLFEMRV